MWGLTSLRSVLLIEIFTCSLARATGNRGVAGCPRRGGSGQATKRRKAERLAWKRGGMTALVRARVDNFLAITTRSEGETSPCKLNLNYLLTKIFFCAKFTLAHSPIV